METMFHARRLLPWGLVLGILLSAGQVAAHHGTNISYDRSKQWTRKVTVVSFTYANPHPNIFFEFTNDRGEMEKWGAELLPNPAALIRAGWSRAKAMEALKPGTVVTVTIAPAKVGGTVGLLVRMQNEKGEEIVTSGGPGQPPPDPDANRAGAAPGTP
jgi:Family of unknown function (DUF6152)